MVKAQEKTTTTTHGPKALKSEGEGALALQKPPAGVRASGGDFKSKTRVAMSARGTGARWAPVGTSSSSRFALAFDRGRPLVFDVDPIPIKRQVSEQRRPTKQIIDLDIADLRVPEAAEEPEDEKNRR